MRLLFIDNDGGGFSDGIDAAEGTTVARLLAGRMPIPEAGDHPTRGEPHGEFGPPPLSFDDCLA